MEKHQTFTSTNATRNLHTPTVYLWNYPLMPFGGIYLPCAVFGIPLFILDDPVN